MKEKILNIAKYLTTGASVVALISGIAISNYKAKVERQKILQAQEETSKNIRSFNDSIYKSVTDLKRDIFDIKNILDHNTVKLDKMNNSYIQHLRGDNKVDQLIKYLESTQEQLKKNNEISLKEIVLPFRDTWTPLSSK